MLGLDGQDAAVFDQVFEFVRDSGLHEVQITLQTPYPGTPLYDRLRAEGRLLHDGEWERCTLFDVNFEPRGMTADELASGFRDLAVRLYSEEFTPRAAGPLQTATARGQAGSFWIVGLSDPIV